MRASVLKTAALLCAALLLSAVAPSPGPRTLDDFNTLAPWTATPSDGVSASIEPTQGHQGQAMRAHFNFNGDGGYASFHRPLPLELPANFELSFWLRGAGAANNLEFKLADQSGDNVWWHVERDLHWPSDWRRVTIRSRQIAFAWGPSEDHALRRTASIDFTVSAAEGGAGAIDIDDLQIRALPPPPAQVPQLMARSSNGDAAAAVDGRLDTVWTSGAGSQNITFDLGFMREFGGVTMRWDPAARPSHYTVQLSGDGSLWGDAINVQAANGVTDWLMLPDSEARYVRVSLAEPGPYRLAEFSVRDLSFGEAPTAFLQALAHDAPRSDFPRSLHQEQNYWTLVGVPGGGPRSSLMSEDAALELGRGGFSVEPFVFANGRRFSWADVQSTQALTDGYIPAPSVTWSGDGWRMSTQALATGTAQAPLLLHRYAITNTSDQPQQITLALAIRPIQVNPPPQFLTTPGGFSPINAIAIEGGDVSVNGAARIHALTPPSFVRATSFDDGAWIDAEPGPSHAANPQGFAAGAMIYQLSLPAHQSRQLSFVSSLHAGDALPAATAGWVDAEWRRTLSDWRIRLNHLRIRAPSNAQRVIDTLRASTASILMSADGPALQPGTRSYGRSWIRDGAMMAQGLLALGLDQPARDYLAWYAPYQYANGKVPCCVGALGADPVPENDSHGELIHLAALVYAYTHDRAALDAAWPHLEAAARYMDEARLSERTPANQVGDRLPRYGMMPPTISHEGYSSRPAYSYWDDFWTLRGFEDIVVLAQARGDAPAAQRWAAARDQFRADLLASIEASGRQFGVDYIPGAADLGDFDATSTTIALAPGGLEDVLPRGRLQRTFDRYWSNFVERRTSSTWRDYTPYELRVVGAFVRLGQPERAHQALDFFFEGQRPQAWRQWAEVVGRDAREPRFIGDLPHGWVASDYLRSVLDFFAYEQDGALVIGAGLPSDWLAGPGISITGLRTPYGQLNYDLRRDGDGYTMRLSGGAHPPGGFIFRAPMAFAEGHAVCVNGARTTTGPIRFPAHDSLIRIARCRDDIRETPRP